jgi:hypothetical protein
LFASPYRTIQFIETRDHNEIAQNSLFNLRQHLKGGPCKLYMSDIRVNFNLREDEYYSYPDIVVTCDKRDNDQRFIRYPISEILRIEKEIIVRALREAAPDRARIRAPVVHEVRLEDRVALEAEILEALGGLGGHRRHRTRR